MLLIGACSNHKASKKPDFIESGKATAFFDEIRNHREQIIEVTNALIEYIDNFEHKDIDNKFISLSVGEAPLRLSFFAESHNNVGIIRDNLAAINLLGTKNELILLEGQSRKLQPKRCEELIYLFYYQNWAWSQRQDKHDVKARNQWLLDEQISQHYQEARPYLHTDRLLLSAMHCAFWDDKILLIKSLSKNNLKNMQARGDSMLKAIHHWQKYYPKITVIAGTWHIPLGDLYLSQAADADFPAFYSALRAENTNSPFPQVNFKKHRFSGNTEATYNYLAQQKIPFMQFLHKRLLQP